MDVSKNMVFAKIKWWRRTIIRYIYKVEKKYFEKEPKIEESMIWTRSKYLHSNWKIKNKDMQIK